VLCCAVGVIRTAARWQWPSAGWRHGWRHRAVHVFGGQSSGYDSAERLAYGATGSVWVAYHSRQSLLQTFTRQRSLRLVSISTEWFRDATHRNSAGMPPALVKKYDTILTACGTPAERRRNAASCRKLLRYRLFRDVFIERKTLVVRCGTLWYGILPERWRPRFSQLTEAMVISIRYTI